jgi:hypothetical protein
VTPRTSRPTRRAAAPLALALAALLPGCPLPQALPEFPSTGAITPPRIVSESATPTETILEVAPDCPAEPVYTLSASVVDENTIENVEARWFVDYLAGNQQREAPRQPPEIIPPIDDLTTIRTVTAWDFKPYAFDPGDAAARQAYRDGGGLHVVELVVSNGFQPGEGTGPRPYRSTEPNFTTQAQRWVFHYVPGGTCGFPAP